MPASSNVDSAFVDVTADGRAARLAKLIAPKEPAETGLVPDKPQPVPVDYTPTGIVRTWVADGQPFLVRAAFHGRSHIARNVLGKEVQVVQIANRGDVVHLDPKDDATVAAVDAGYLAPFEG